MTGGEIAAFMARQGLRSAPQAGSTEPAKFLVCAKPQFFSRKWEGGTRLLVSSERTQATVDGSRQCQVGKEEGTDGAKDSLWPGGAGRGLKECTGQESGAAGAN